jgi:pimeloyl-ACP methyl ester carboxylesterase
LGSAHKAAVALLLLGIALFAMTCSCPGVRISDRTPLTLRDGKHVLDVEDRCWGGISRVWTYRPAGAISPRVVMVIHGAGRNAEDYLDSWVDIADEHQLFVVAPEFPDYNAIRVNGEWEWRFNTGNVVGWFGWDVDHDDWYFESIEHLFRTIRRSDPRVQERYVLFGHSAGGQFVHRMVMFLPEARFDLAIAANPGWYTEPTEELDFPYGLSGAPCSGEVIETAFGRPLVVFLGTEDSPDQGSFRTSERAMAQGTTRVERGIRFHREAQRISSERNVPFEWALEYAEGIGHDYRGMARAAVRLLRERGLVNQ